MHEMHEKNWERRLTKRLRLKQGLILNGWSDLSESKKFGLIEKEICQERWENEKWNLTSTLNRKCISMDRGFYWEFVEL